MRLLILLVLAAFALAQNPCDNSYYCCDCPGNTWTYTLNDDGDCPSDCTHASQGYVAPTTEPNYVRPSRSMNILSSTVTVNPVTWQHVITQHCGGNAKGWFYATSQSSTALGDASYENGHYFLNYHGGSVYALGYNVANAQFYPPIAGQGFACGGEEIGLDPNDIFLGFSGYDYYFPFDTTTPSFDTCGTKYTPGMTPTFTATHHQEANIGICWFGFIAVGPDGNVDILSIGPSASDGGISAQLQSGSELHGVVVRWTTSSPGLMTSTQKVRSFNPAGTRIGVPFQRTLGAGATTWISVASQRCSSNNPIYFINTTSTELPSNVIHPRVGTYIVDPYGTSEYHIRYNYRTGQFLNPTPVGHFDCLGGVIGPGSNELVLGLTGFNGYIPFDTNTPVDACGIRYIPSQGIFPSSESQGTDHCGYIFIIDRPGQRPAFVVILAHVGGVTVPLKPTETIHGVVARWASPLV